MRWYPVLVGVMVLAGTTLAAHAEFANRRSWVSGAGMNAGVCSSVAPCRTLQFAVDQIASGGEVNVKDSADYGPVTITKSVSIIADGSVAEVNVLSGTTGVTVQASSVDTVVLRGLTFSGRDSVRTYGVRVETAGSTVIDHCVFTGLDHAVYFSSVTSNTVVDSLFFRNGEAIVNMFNRRVYLARNVITQNNLGLIGDFYSFGDNDITDRDANNTTLNGVSRR